MQQPVKYFHKRLNSTNLYVNQLLLKQPVREPFWVRADDQFEGRGQGEHTWSSMPGLNLTGTLAIFPEQFEAAHQFAISQVFALAAAGFLELYVDHVRIKWPNDLYAGNEKLGGILIETGILGKYIDHAILGIGININQQVFPAELPNPVSLSMLTGCKYDLIQLENLFLESFINHYQLIESGRFEEINNRYLSKLYRFNEYAHFKCGEEVFKARITAVSEYGHLILQSDDGSTQSYAYQEVEYVI